MNDQPFSACRSEPSLSGLVKSFHVLALYSAPTHVPPCSQVNSRQTAPLATSACHLLAEGLCTCCGRCLECHPSPRFPVSSFTAFFLWSGAHSSCSSHILYLCIMDSDTLHLLWISEGLLLILGLQSPLASYLAPYANGVHSGNSPSGRKMVCEPVVLIMSTFFLRSMEHQCHFNISSPGSMSTGSS